MTVNTKARQNDCADFRFIDLLSRDETFEEAFVSGMSAPENALPCRFLYDAQGSALFDRICALPEYYPTRTEIAVLEANAGVIADIVGPHAALIELGSGSSIKTHILLKRLKTPSAYVPVDVSREHLRAAAQRIACEYPAISVTAICADYAERFALPESAGRRVAFFPGSTIGNLTRDDAKSLLALWRDRLGPGGQMIIGVDLKKDPKRLEAAYNDSEGVTEAFIKNILARANRELDGDFDLDDFAYRVRWNSEAGRIEMRVESRRAQTVTAAGIRLFFRKGETIHIENSHKYGVEEFSSIARAAGFSSCARFVDDDRLFSVHVLETD